MHPLKPRLYDDSLRYKHITESLPPGILGEVHCHSMYELIYLVSGDVTHGIEGRQYHLHPGDLVIIQPAKYHFLRIDSTAPYERYNILFDPQLHRISAVDRLETGLEVLNLSGNPMAADIFHRLDYYYDQADRQTFEEVFRLALNELLINLSLSVSTPIREEGILSPVVEQALAYINANLFSISGVEEVAAALFISPSYLFHLFRNCLHQSPKRYINDKRLLVARQRIREGERPTVVCKECGFREYSNFYRSYCSFFGHAPSEEVHI